MERISKTGRWFVTKTTPWLIEQAIDMMEFRGLQETVDKIRGVYNPNTLIAFISSHRSHGEVATTIETIRRTRALIPEIGTFYLPIAASLFRGQQGAYANTYFHYGAKPVLEGIGVKALPVATDNDVKKRGIKPSVSDAKAFKEAVAETSSGFFIFPEASVQGGRHKRILGLPVGKMYGSIPFNEKVLQELLQGAQRNHREVLIVPVGTTGTNNIVSADFLNPTFWALAVLGLQRFGIRPKLATITFGKPFHLDKEEFGEGKNIDGGKLTNFVALKVNSLLPENERGVYR